MAAQQIHVILDRVNKICSYAKICSYVKKEICSYVLMSKKEICSYVLMSKKNMLICYYVFNMFLCQKQGKEKYYEKD